MFYELWLMFIFGLIAGLFLAALYALRFPTGTIRIDLRNPEKELYRFEFDDLDILPKSKYLILKVDTNANLSHK